MNTTTTATKNFDPHARNGRGQMGYLATTPNGIQRWATTAAKAIEVANRQEAAYVEAGMLDEVLANLATTN